jgi:hypothetical protein
MTGTQNLALGESTAEFDGRWWYLKWSSKISSCRKRPKDLLVNVYMCLVVRKVPGLFILSSGFRRLLQTALDYGTPSRRFYSMLSQEADRIRGDLLV